MKLFSNNKIFQQFQFSLESDFEKEVVFNSKQFFGSNSIYIDAKRKIQTKNIGNSIPDGFLFDLSDKKNPEFYIVATYFPRSQSSLVFTRTLKVKTNL